MQKNYSLNKLIFLLLCLFYFQDSKGETMLSFSLCSPAVSPGWINTPDSTKGVKSIFEFAASLKDVNGKSLKLSEKKKLFREQIRAIKNAGNKTKNEKILLTILTVLAFIGAVAILGNIAYNGGAGLWPGVGLLVCIFLLVFFLKRIW